MYPPEGFKFSDDEPLVTSAAGLMVQWLTQIRVDDMPFEDFQKILEKIAKDTEEGVIEELKKSGNDIDELDVKAGQVLKKSKIDRGFTQ